MIAEGCGDGAAEGRTRGSRETPRIHDAGGLPAPVDPRTFLADRGPAGPRAIEAPMRRARRMHSNDPTEPVPRDTDRAGAPERGLPAAAPHTSPDIRRAALAPVSTIARAD